MKLYQVYLHCDTVYEFTIKAESEEQAEEFIRSRQAPHPTYMTSSDIKYLNISNPKDLPLV